MAPAPLARLAALLAQPRVARLMQTLNPPGEETRLVGGAVRNALLGVPADDVDLATTLLPAEIIRRGEAMGWKVVPTGIEHGTVTLFCEEQGFEVTTLRRDVETFGRHARVMFGRDFHEDAARRDFTINAMSVGPGGVLSDYFGGAEDLAAGRVRFIGAAETRLREDFLRGLRFLRFSARYATGALDPQGLAAMLVLRNGFATLSRERVRQELLKLLMAPRVLAVLAEADSAGLLPDLVGLPVDMARFSARARLAAAEEPVPWPGLARLAALLPAGAVAAGGLQQALRLSNVETAWLARLAAGEALIEAAPAHLASRLAVACQDAAPEALRLAASRSARPEIMLGLVPQVEAHPRLLISGRDLLAAGLPPGPQIGARLARLTEIWITSGAPAAEAEQRRLLDHLLAGAATSGPADAGGH